MNATEVINPCKDILQDADGITYETGQLLDYLNDGQRAVSILRPDASQETVDIQLTAGQTEQDVGGRRLIDVHYNMGSDGSTPGNAIRQVDRDVKDAFEPDWHTATPAVAIKEFMYDPKIPKKFWVSPPVHGSTAVFVKLSRAINPANVADITDAITIDDVYSPALQEWILYRAFARDSEQTPNFVRAGQHFKAFFNIMGVKLQADMAVTPKIIEMINGAV